jgi:2-polyprenyl-6-methoxyphenol hydroxylase-like FAD-dependent oxidoreductase
VSARPADCDVLIAGGGPAGMVAGLLFSRAGLKTIVLEKHGDFLRDFRGDTIHPSTMEVFRQLDLLDSLLRRPHQRMGTIAVRWLGHRIEVADFAGLPVAAPYIAFMPQWEFLDFCADAAATRPTFDLRMNTSAQDIVVESETVVGLRVATAGGENTIRARLTIAADGRGSVLRGRAALPLSVLGAPIDVLWFSLPRRGDAAGEDSLLNAAPGTMVITIDRGNYWQCAFVIAKGGRDALAATGIDDLRRRTAQAAPHVADAVGALTSFDQVKLLSVAVDRLDRWWRPGLLAIGDAAHAMSPIGGVGINVAIQDAVAAANLLVPRLRGGALPPDALEAVQRRRLWPARATQFVQVQVQNRVLAPLIGGAEVSQAAPLPLRAAGKLPPLRRLLARAVGLGVRPEAVDPAILA